MKVEVNYDGDIAILRAHGRISELNEASEFRRIIRDNIQRGYKKLVLVLDQLTYISSTGLGELVATYTASAKAGGRTVLVSPTNRLKAIFETTKLDSVYDVFSSVDDAIKHLREERFAKPGG